MNARAPQRLLLVEDNPGDAQLVGELLTETERDNFEIVHVPLMAAAVQTLRSHPVDVVVLDLRLPDCHGVEAVKAVRSIAAEVPIVVLTGSDDEQLAMACIDAGAQDYLPKNEVRAQNLRRAIGYAITRIRDAQLRDLQQTLAHYRTLSSATHATSITAAMAGTGAVAQRQPQAFGQIVRAYYGLLEPYLVRAADRVDAPAAVKEMLITALGDAGGGPRDLLDVHVAALDQALAVHISSHARSIVFESRLLALEMMGLLVDYYRVGHRRRTLEEPTP
ncbi:MAG: response regulator [Rubrivivax sp.]|jgi:DNA-binding response OmpR family regulator|nr:response regulator [Rubrivivax sp.]